jgi:hypothetical protein
MIESFLRPPSGALLAADAVRLVGVMSVVAVLLWWSPVDVAVFALSMIGLVLPRFLGVRPALDGAFGISLLVAAWFSVLGLYVSAPLVDLPVHFVLNGLVAAVAYVLLARAGVLPESPDVAHPRLGVAVVTTALGVVGGVLWEFGEWAGHAFVDDTIFVGYTDTLGDLAVGALGSLLAGASMSYLAARQWRPRAAVPAPRDRSSAR